VSSLQTAAAKLGVAWADMAAVSLHGRDSLLPLGHALLERRPVCLLTDERFNPDVALAVFTDRGVTDYTAHIFGRLGFPEESRRSFRLEEGLAAAMPPSPNLIFLLPDGGTGPGPRLGTPDEDYAHEKGLITKWPVRAAALAALRIEPHHCVWDLGAGSGAVAVEAASLARRGRVVAVEKNPGRVEYIRENRRRFRVPHLDIVEGSAPLCLEGLPDPDRVFLGGGLGADREDGAALIRAVWDRLAPGGRIVISCVLLESLSLCREALDGLGAKGEVVSLNAAVSAPLGAGDRLAAHNPVFLVAADRDAGG
jgi:precorrin-6Y C5,15-methyltransferase (decarboxylating)